MINPTPTTCIAMSLEIPKREHATGINRREPPAIPDAPHAESVAKILNTIAVGMLTLIPSVCYYDCDCCSIHINRRTKRNGYGIIIFI